MALTRLLDEWPLLICGPILRRVTPDDVAVFVATKTACTVQLLLMEAGDTTPAWVNIPLETRALGQSLHVTVCHLTMPSGEQLVPGVVYQYDLRMTPTDTGVTETLADQPGLLSGTDSLGYIQGVLPSFALSPGLDDLNLLHGSCRKAHGGGWDALAMVDRLIDRARTGDATTNPALRRPHQLLLTGDQIYADDVALAILSTLQEAGGLLCAQSPEETFPGGLAMTSPQLRPGTARAGYLEANSELSSDYGMNHLMFFAEFCAMCVMCWSDELWPRSANGRLQVGAVAVEDELAKQDGEERIKLAAFLRTLRRARRALANVPTLMMFDDHEISDDWNLDRGWRDSARSNPVQHRIVRNGLLAFAVFQAWGNEPSRFGAGVPLGLLDLVTIPPGNTAPPIAANPAAADQFLDLAPAGTAQRMSWDWTFDGPEHRVIALDTRTRRDYVSAGPRTAGLLTAAEMQRQLTDHRPPAIDTRLCFVIAPAPVVGHPLVEQVLQPGMAMVKGGRAADNEAWGVNRIAYQAILRRLADFGRVVVLSGDVHYAFTNYTAYFGANGQAPARIVQLCSSAGKNADGMTRAIQFGGYLGAKGEGWLGFASPLTSTLDALLMAALGIAGVLTTISPIQHNLLTRIRLFRLFSTPAVVPAGPWRSVPAWQEVKRLADRADPRDWRYQVAFVQDRRSGGERLAMALEIDPRPPPSGAVDVIREAHKAVVGEPNVGQIRVRIQNGRPVVVHRIHWMTSGDLEDSAQTCTEHVAPLSPPGPDERPEPFL